jgi:hypothetical protein
MGKRVRYPDRLIFALVLMLSLESNQAFADRALNRTLSEQLSERYALTLEYSYFDESLDFLDYQSKLGTGSRPDQAQISGIEIQIPFLDRWQVVYNYQETEGRAVRSSEPRAVKTTVKNHLLEVVYSDWSLADWNGHAFITVERGKQDPLSIDCYERGLLTLGGSCDSADLRFFDSDVYRDTGETIYLPVLTSNAEQQSYSLGLNLTRKLSSWQFVHYFELRESEIEVTFDSPLFRITDSFVLGTSFQGQTVGAIINGLKSELPQSTPWKERSITYEFSALRPFGQKWMGVAKIRGIKIFRSNYQTNSSNRNIDGNLSLDLSLWYSPTRTLSAYVRAEAFQHYVAGFEPLAYNRRTARLFEQPYGQISIGVVLVTP